MTTPHFAESIGPEDVQALVRVFSILEAVAGHSAGITLGDISRTVGLHKSTTFRMVKTMVKLGYLARVENNKLYCVTERLKGPTPRPSAARSGWSTSPLPLPREGVAGARWRTTRRRENAERRQGFQKHRE
jgi:hypothetical protein